MKIYYNNDEHKTVTIRVISEPKNIMDQDFIRYETFKANEARVIELDAPEGSIPYVKRWESGQILVTYLRVEHVAELSSHRDERMDGKI